MTRPRNIADGINRIDTSAADATAITVDASENVGIGIATPSTDLHLFKTTGDVGITVQSSATANAKAFVDLYGRDASNVNQIWKIENDAHSLKIKDDGSTKMTLDASGNLGIGTGSDAPQQKLDVRGEIAISNSTTSYWNLNRDDSTGALTFSDTGGTPDMVLDTSGNLLVGKSSSDLTTTGSEVQDGAMRIISSSTSTNLATSSGASLLLANPSATNGNFSNIGSYNTNQLVDSQINFIHESHSSRTGAIGFSTHDGSSLGEVMRVTSGGNLHVGRTTADSSIAGFTAQGNGVMYNAFAGRPYYVNRLSSDGDLIEFAKDGTTGGSIGISGNGIYFGDEGDTAIVIDSNSDAIIPFNPGSRTVRDNHIDLGSSSGRYDDVFATNGTIQTSDRNEKQQIASLTNAEITAAKAISKLFKTFKWNDKVEAKGDAARTHAGVIAQDVQQAMSDAGLDAANYAFWCSNTWWEAQTEVPAVEADEENGIEAQDAYTRTDTYDTAEEAPEGATERTRMGIRYPELLAFIGAATEQRLADIETRLTALEN